MEYSPLRSRPHARQTTQHGCLFGKVRLPCKHGLQLIGRDTVIEGEDDNPGIPCGALASTAVTAFLSRPPVPDKMRPSYRPASACCIGKTPTKSRIA